jgi:hypothetical protein
VKIERTQLIDELVDFATNGNGVVIGQPGAGKTYALAELRARLKAAGFPHLVLPVERLGSASAAEIRNVLNRDGDFVELLQTAARGQKSPAVLIFDGFDAARGEVERTGVFQMIARAVTGLAGSWHVIVSVRTFDAKKSRRLLDLFPLGDSAGCRQFNIPLLTEDEVRQVFPQIPHLAALHEHGTPEFRALLRVPFNLWMVERILRGSPAAGEFSHVASEVQLLELYWKHRIRAGVAPEDREYLLKKLTGLMVAKHTLTVRRADVYEPAVRDVWHALLSDEVLVEVPEAEPGVAFSHNILFDFAAAVYLLDPAPEIFARFVAEEPARPLFLRPSLLYHFTRLWHFDRKSFWKNFWSAISRDEVSLRQIIRLVLPAVLIQEARLPADLAPLSDRQAEAVGIEAVAFSLQALRILDSGHIGLWSSFLREISRRLDRKFAWDAGTIATAIVESTKAPEVLANCGQTGRNLLAWSWANRKDAQAGQWFERMAGLVAVPLVAKTFATNAVESGALLQQVLDVVGEPDFPIDCIFRLVHETKHFMRLDPALVGRIYERVFGYVETSDAKTNMGGPILALISNRRQDFESCRYALLQDFPKFLAEAPREAIRSGLRAVQAHVVQAHVIRSLRAGKSLEDVTKPFAFRGGTAWLVHDGSAIWDESSYPDQEMGLADALFKWLERAADADRAGELDDFLVALAGEPRGAFLWSRLLACAAEHPKNLTGRIWELAAAADVAESSDAVHSLGAFLEQAAALLSEDQRAVIETMILALPASATGDRREYLEHRRDRLLARMPEGTLVTGPARSLRQELAAAERLPPNAPLFTFSSSSRPYTEVDMFRDKGVEPDSPPNAAVRTLYEPLRKWEEAKKEPGAVEALLPVAAELDALLHNPPAADQAVLRAAATHLASFASAALRQTKTADSDRFRLLRRLVLEAAAHADPEPRADEEEKWTYPAWSPAPRNDAAQALPWLTHFGEDADALAAIGRLAEDPVPSVRFLLACDIWRLHEHCPAEMWRLLDGLVAREKNSVVLQGVTQSIWELINRDPARSQQLVQKLLTRETEETDEDDERASAHLIAMVVDYAVERDDPWAKETLALWRAKPVEFAASLGASARRLIEHFKPQHPADGAARARLLLLDHLEAAAQGLKVLQRPDSGLAKKVVQKKWRSLYGVIDNTVMRLYFAADVNPQLRQRTESTLNDRSRERFWRDSQPLLQKVLSFGKEPNTGMLLAPTAHYFMELLNGVVAYDPPRVLAFASEVVQCSKRFGYNLDSIAMKETVKLVESLLVDYRGDIQGEAAVRDLMGLLDAFVEAGWPEALQLVWRLDEIYR